MKKRLAGMLSWVLAVGLLTGGVGAAQPDAGMPGDGGAAAQTQAAPTAAKVLVDGREILLEAYNIGGNNFFKIRDIAAVLHGTEKQFEVAWDGEKSAVSLTSRRGYTPVGGELAQGDGRVKTAVVSAATVYIDGDQVSLTAYNIGGNNFVKLRDLGQGLNFGVGWDGNVVVDTSTGYEDPDAAPPTEEPDAAPPTEEPEDQSRAWEQEVLALTNQERAKQDLPPLLWNETAAQAAREHSRDMAESNFFEHTNLNGESPYDRMKRHGLTFRAGAENIAAGQSSPEEVVREWMQSPGHRANILDGDLTELGVGYFYTKGAYVHYWTQNFLTP